MTLQNTSTHIPIWHKNFWLMALSTLLLSVSVYIQIPAISQWLNKLGLTYWETGSILGVFGLGMFLLGPLCSYLIQRYRRNVVCQWAIIGMMISTGAMLYVDCTKNVFSFFIIMCVLRLLQGAFFGLAQMILCSTLIIDTIDSFHRTEANDITSWFARFALPIGPLIGILLYELTGIVGSVIASLACTLIVLIFIQMVKFPFKTPEEDSHKFRLDRFFLPQGWLLFVNIMVMTFICGLLLSIVLSPLFYTIVIVGLVIAIIFLRFVFPNLEQKNLITTGFLLLAMSVIVMFTKIQYLAPLFLGCSIGIIGARFLLCFIKMSRHCQRGTSQSTYILGWEAGVYLGLFCGFSIIGHQSMALLYLALATVIFSLALYVFYTHKWYIKNKNR